MNGARACTLMLLLLVLLVATAAWSAAAEQTALTLTAGHSYGPSNEIRFVQLGGSWLWDYDRIWPHRAPEPLHFKVEAAAGMAFSPHGRALLSTNMLALYRLSGWKRWGLEPYAEAGVGLLYSDFQLKKQGLRLNFNPVIGLGAELTHNQHQRWFIAVRLHHLSNGGLHHDNHGLNSVVLQLGRCF